MEEQKKTEKKMSYETLEKDYMLLKAQFERALEELDKANVSSLLQRLTFLFKVLEQYAHFDPVFVEKCSKEIESILTVEEEKEEK